MNKQLTLSTFKKQRKNLMRKSQKHITSYLLEVMKTRNGIETYIISEPNKEQSTIIRLVKN
jgi:hypothetical protein